MKKSTSFISAVLAGAMLIPTIAGAYEEYPVRPTYPGSSASEEEKAEYIEKCRAYNEELIAGYQNGTIDLDMNMDGKVDAIDSLAVMTYYSEISIGITDPGNSYIMDETVYNYTNNADDIIYYEFNNDMRSKISKYCNGYGDADYASNILICIYSNTIMGDVNMDGIVDSDDASEILSCYSDRSVGHFGYNSFNQLYNFKHCADVNGDGLIDAGDASDVLSMYSENSTT